MQLRGLEYSGPFMCATEKYLPLITPTLFSRELSHWGAERWKPKTDAACRKATQATGTAGSAQKWGAPRTKPNGPSRATSAQMSCVMFQISAEKKGKKRPRITCSQLPVSCHDCRGKERGRRWGHVPARQMLPPCSTQTAHGPAALVVPQTTGPFQI